MPRYEWWAEQWQGDAPLLTPESSTIHLRGFIEVFGNRLHAGNHQDDGEADVLPRNDEHQCPDGDFRIGDPVRPAKSYFS